MRTSAQDITGDLGPLYQANGGAAPAIPMYSFNSPACILWQAVYSGLRSRNWTHEQAVDWLQSKNPRYALAGSLGDALRDAGFAIAAKA